MIARLARDEKSREEQHEKILGLAAQKQESDRWQRLHCLIGSSDGKKFRMFAQGLTFEMMIAHANRKFQEMSDRYILIRDSLHPLELNIIDNYQAGEIRSTKNLSGLHQEGKLIGVVSHVSALKERIATQIQVTPGAGGCSRLNGPGCVAH